MRCGNCKDNHDTADEVRSCYKFNGPTGLEPMSSDEPQWPPSDKQIAYVLGLQKERMLPAWWMDYDEAGLKRLDRDVVSDIIKQLKGFQFKVDSEHRDVPPGRYALKMNTAQGEQWRFFEVQDGKNRWAGYKFIKRLIGSPGDYQKSPLGREDRATIMRLIEEDPKRAAIDYGHQSKHCSRCGSALSDPDSIAAGIGPYCAEKLGW